VVTAIFIGGCAASFGPGYAVDKQDIEVQFTPGPPSHISIKSNYQLTNTGTRPLSSLELRLPGRRRFNSSKVKINWDGQALTGEQSPDYSRATLLNLPQTWAMSAHHNLQIYMDLESQPADSSYLGFAPDAFFLPALGWAPELLPSRGLFGTGGVPPGKWDLTVHIPKDFIVHTSGTHTKISRHGDDQTVRATQSVADTYPFVIAGRYVTKQIGSGRQKIYFWTRKTQDAGDLRAVSDALLKTLASYNALFGERSVARAPSGFFGRHHALHGDPPLYLVECPVIPGCFSGQTERLARMLVGNEHEVPAEMVSLDSAMVDPKPGLKNMITAVAPALAATWLGYGQSPGFYEQAPPLSAFPAFAAAVGNEALRGPTARAEIIRRVLARIPKANGGAKTDDENVLRAKSFLFFFALQDRYGSEVFRKAVTHMLDARSNSGFDLDDLIAAFDEESHGNTAEFVRLWMKHPGVPADFRARYKNTSANREATNKELTP
jgi:hypothetical protein